MSLLTDTLLSLAKSMGIAPIQLNYQGLCTLVIDGHLPVCIRAEFGSGTLCFIGPLCPDSPLANVNSYLLRQNTQQLLVNQPSVFWDVRLGLAAFQRISVADMSTKEVEQSLGTFLEWLFTQRDRLKAPPVLEEAGAVPLLQPETLKQHKTSKQHCNVKV